LQEDVWFCERAELLSGMLFSECLSDGEVFYVSGVDLPGGGPLVHPKVTVPGSAAAVYASSDNPTQEVMLSAADVLRNSLIVSEVGQELFVALPFVTMYMKLEERR